MVNQSRRLIVVDHPELAQQGYPYCVCTRCGPLHFQAPGAIQPYCIHCQVCMRQDMADDERRRAEQAAAVKAGPKQSIPDSLRWAVWERDNFTCQKCGRRRQLSIDHIVPESRGGLTIYSNLQTLCRSCNSRKGDRLEMDATQESV